MSVILQCKIRISYKILHGVQSVGLGCLPVQPPRRYVASSWWALAVGECMQLLATPILLCHKLYENSTLAMHFVCIGLSQLTWEDSLSDPTISRSAATFNNFVCHGAMNAAQAQEHISIFFLCRAVTTHIGGSIVSRL